MGVSLFRTARRSRAVPPGCTDWGFQWFTLLVWIWFASSAGGDFVLNDNCLKYGKER